MYVVELSVQDQLYTTSEGWPGGIPSPLAYFEMRARQLSVLYRACHGPSTWRRMEGVSVGSDLAQRRGTRQLSVLVPASHTNISAHDCTVRFVGVQLASLAGSSAQRIGKGRGLLATFKDAPKRSRLAIKAEQAYSCQQVVGEGQEEMEPGSGAWSMLWSLAGRLTQRRPEVLKRSPHRPRPDEWQTTGAWSATQYYRAWAAHPAAPLRQVQPWNKDILWAAATLSDADAAGSSAPQSAPWRRMEDGPANPSMLRSLRGLRPLAVLIPDAYTQIPKVRQGDGE
ncbi:hypothetical protein F751_6568 [Auxenochlorella protothecoides]|uniref:Uncharacterized protein n=1 Tax=Auxenochlorella protothecoides TaxID=3075 RepID=A0A087STJ5_AUXPR|nr:hypothetical protein F751_6568 [Auxenochlorella protothecoides]KFM29049.1 hypothetical protein F751_6568 [Auxenochlorella protothecoides]